MSALRQLLGAIWAAVWLRGRLVGLRLPRLFGGHRSPDAGFDFHLAAAEIPVEGVDYEPIELPAELMARLDVTRGELLGYARDLTQRARPRRRRRGRTAALSVAALIGLGALGAGASALVSGSTGVPAVDRLLGIYEQGLDKPGASDRPGPSGSDLQPSPSKASEPIETTFPDGSRSVTTFYVARDGQICWAVADLDGGRSGGLSCESPSVVSSGMQDGGYVPGIGVGTSYVVVRGYVSGDVVSLSGRGPSGPLDVQLGELWTPRSTPAVGPLKPFVAVAHLDVQPKLDTPAEAPELHLRSYDFDAMTEDGHQILIKP